MNPLDKLTEKERQFLQSEGFEKNPYGVFVYKSSNENHIISLDSILSDYKEWLLENKIVKLINN